MSYRTKKATWFAMPSQGLLIAMGVVLPLAFVVAYRIQTLGSFGFGNAVASSRPIGSPGGNPHIPPDAAPTLEGIDALKENLRLLEGGERKMNGAIGYTATLHRQERVDGELLQPETMLVTLRHAPFGVHLRWREGDTGREVLYVDGDDDGMLVRLGGWKGRMMPAVHIDPEGTAAMSRSRYAISQCGMLAMCRLLIGYRRTDLAGSARAQCRMFENYRYDGRDCVYFLMEYDSPTQSEASRVYRKSIQVIDRELGIPLWMANYTWPDEGETYESDAALDEATLIERYSYSDIAFVDEFPPDEFRRDNPRYGFDE